MSEPLREDRIAEIKAEVTVRKHRVRDLHQCLTELKWRRKRMVRGQWAHEHARLKSELDQATLDLEQSRQQLVEISGTDQISPKTGLLIRAFWVLEGLDAAGVDVGRDGLELLEDITTHLPADLLAQGTSRREQDHV